MRLQDLFDKWNLTGLKVKTPVMEMEWHPSEPDKDAAWDLYVELLTRIATQPLPDEDGIEKTALESVHKLFALTRETLKTHGRSCIHFTRIAVVVLNQVIRPFTARWHKLSEEGAFNNPENCKEFRQELRGLQADLVNYTKLLSDLADVEDLTEIEETE